ncbi:MAG: Hpt domain-containing protein [Oligoflexales bacterium]
MDNSIIHHEYSRHLEEILELKEIAGENINSLLFAKSNLSKDQRSQIEMAIESIIGDRIISFDLNEHLLVHDMDLYFGDDRVKHLEITWEAIRSDDDLVEKMLVIIKDMTEIRGLQEEAEKQKEKLKVIEIILSYGLESFERFYTSSSKMIKSSLEIVQEVDSKVPSERQIANLFRKMHTIKGNARTFGLQEIANEAHATEEIYKHIKVKTAKFQKKNLLEELGKIKTHLESLNDLVKTKFKKPSWVIHKIFSKILLKL